MIQVQIYGWLIILAFFAIITILHKAGKRSMTKRSNNRKNRPNYARTAPSECNRSFEYYKKKFEGFKTDFNYTDKLTKKLRDRGYNVGIYATSYGIGIYNRVGHEGTVWQTRMDIEDELNRLNIKYDIEYSDGGWVTRYMIPFNAEVLMKLDAV